ncbi:ABC transporter ATP-binding protein [uncultured Mameliella sp.]|jgi:ABC-type nitrate/sulfonate/bicarbonate transport system ATPase subunit|uniref:ABC transporter ATP-binding protein n=1 Tax=uncultured Mameliella sp. TaxID=1447087 RepID=UPI002631314F|nr:ABC transporter ATP-binding protein [uncultured Mameliella sp.]
MIRVRIEAKHFGEAQVLGRVHFDIAPGECVALVGPSGIGKSTILRILAGTDEDFTGHVDRPERMAVVFQEPTLLPWRNVIQNLTLVHPDLGTEGARTALDRVGLAGKETLFPGQLSLGQQRRLALARGFATPPDLLIMDEPFASLDAETAERMLALTESLMATTRPATLFVTHDRAEAERLADRILRLDGAPATLADIT